MEKFNRRTLLKTAAATGAALAAPVYVRTAAARTTTITVASLLGDDKPETKVWVRIGELVEAKLPGQFKFNVVKNGALGGEKEVAEGARLGSVQASLSTVSSLSGWVPELQILDLPFLFRDSDHVRRTVDGRVGADLKQKLASQNFVIGGFINYGARHLLTKEPVTRPEQLKGKTIRVIQSPLHTRLWRAFGTTPVGIPITETYNALSTGVADAMDLTKSAYAGFKLYEVVPYMTETGHIWASGVIFYATSFWNRLDDEQKAVFLAASQEGAVYFNQLIVEDETASAEQSLKNGGKLLKPEAFEEWQKGAQGVWRDFAGIVGGLDRIKAVQAA
ncbi:TRAP transporter substrate-binding protein [Neorhizobium petrolearium]|uniref:TRAP transporter substrate-binding protein n=1 Tax=Neorhizobium petrolearium TaxID=515361 RepID=A0ABY8M7Y2_9HYPH|nr:TRAP transporter substrate-binding protein [Neorhizobium petrolearium]MCC2610504.1 TRAP transporter substrate-binding protein [Neorhizobium petrolearium]WGI70645.1 TRAP transporter substrate-binding protein [Neorhizobium petrolearium]